MKEEEIKNNPKPLWLKVSLAILTAWVSFILSMGAFLVITSIIQNVFNGFDIEGTPAFILLVFTLAISILVSYRTTKWVSKKLEKRNTQTSYLVLFILILLTLLTIPTPMTYCYFQ